MRVVHPQPPTRSGVHDGLAWAAFEPEGDPVGGVVVLPGAGSTKEAHHDFARTARAAGLAVMTFDVRGHGASQGALDSRAIDDVAGMADLLRERHGADLPVGLRGSSMGGYLSLISAEAVRAAAVVAICPAPGSLLRRGLELGRFPFRADGEALGALLDAHDMADAAARLDAPLLLLHAAGDEQVPVEHSRELARVARDVKYVELPGGHHRSIQHDAELQGETVRFLVRALGAAAG